MASKRWSHTATLVDKTLYFYGGRSGASAQNSSYSAQLLALDLSAAFSTDAAPFTVITTSDAPQIAQHVAAPSSNGIIVYGGTMPTVNGPLAYRYDIGSKTWKALSDAPSPRRYKASLAYVENDPQVAYLYGGVSDQTSTAGNGTVIYQDLYPLKQGANTFETKMSVVGNPGPRYQHAGVLLDNGLLIILGGSSGLAQLAPLDSVHVYDTSAKSWQLQKTTGQIPLPRRDFAAVGVQKNVIIHGGTDVNYAAYYDDVAVLDTESWTWTAPALRNAPPGRYAHRANMIGANTMLVSFGFTAAGGDSGVYALNTEQWEFVGQYQPNFTSGVNVVGIVAGSIAGFLGLIVLVLGIILFVRRRRQRKEEKEVMASMTRLSSLTPYNKPRPPTPNMQLPESARLTSSMASTITHQPSTGSSFYYEPEVRPMSSVTAFVYNNNHTAYGTPEGNVSPGADLNRHGSIDQQISASMEAQVHLVPKRKLYVSNPDNQH